MNFPINTSVNYLNFINNIKCESEYRNNSELISIEKQLIGLNLGESFA